MGRKLTEKTEPALRIEYVPLDKIARFDKNPKKHDVGALVTSIRRYGFRDAPIFDGTLKALVAGHGRLKALEAMRGEGDKPPAGIIEHSAGQWLVPVQMGVDSKSAAEAKAFLIDHNTLTLSGGDLGVDSMLRLYDQGGLEELLRESGPTVSFDGEDIDELINGKKEVVEDDPSALIDAAKELEKKWGTKLGQLWLLGEHRVLCGDSTNAEDVGRVMGGEKAVIMNTDPPYGIAYVSGAQSKDQAGGFAEIENDDLDGEKLQAFLESTIRAAVPHLVKNAAFYLWHPMLTQGTFFAAAAAAAADILIHRQIIWEKPSLVFGRGDYHWKHELCFYGWQRGNRPPFYGERNQTTVWPIGRENDGIHPTQKPVELFSIPMRNHSKTGEVCYEPFAGSGSQFVAADQLNRKCYGIEISPQYVAVILERWSKATGGEPRLES